MGQFNDIGLPWVEYSKNNWREFAATPQGAEAILGNSNEYIDAHNRSIRRSAEVGTIIVGMGTGTLYTIENTIADKFHNPEQLRQVYATAAQQRPELAISSQDLRNVAGGDVITRNAMDALLAQGASGQYKLEEAIYRRVAQDHSDNRSWGNAPHNDNEFNYDAAERAPKALLTAIVNDPMYKYSKDSPSTIKLEQYAAHQLFTKDPAAAARFAETYRNELPASVTQWLTPPASAATAQPASIGATQPAAVAPAADAPAPVVAANEARSTGGEAKPVSAAAPTQVAALNSAQPEQATAPHHHYTATEKQQFLEARGYATDKGGADGIVDGHYGRISHNAERHFADDLTSGKLPISQLSPELLAQAKEMFPESMRNIQTSGAVNAATLQTAQVERSGGRSA